MLKTYEEKLSLIKADIICVGQTVLEANQEAFTALKNKEIDDFKNITLSMKKIISKSNEIDNAIVATLALYSPEARDLREMVSYLKITNELVRAASNTKSYIKIFRKSYSEDLNCTAILEYAVPLQKSANLSLEIALNMMEHRDLATIEENYNRVIVEESKTDDLYSMIEKNILKLISKHLELSKDYFDLLSSFRKIEKTADRATSIASLLLFAHVGGEIERT